MDTKQILSFLEQVRDNNNRPWFLQHKAEYQACKADFDKAVAEAIARYSEFDDGIKHLQVKDCVYRFYRDIRFSPDKSPYKRHFGAYICNYGRKSLYGGYYLHIEPDNCMLAIGCYWLPTNILTSCRNEIMGNIDTWREAVENKGFVKLFGRPNQTTWDDGKRGFGLEALKTVPSGFPRDYEYIEYLRMKDYCAWVRVPDDFFEGSDWLTRSAEIFKTGKPMMDFINAVVEDYLD